MCSAGGDTCVSYRGISSALAGRTTIALVVYVVAAAASAHPLLHHPDA